MEESIQKKQDITSLANQINALWRRLGQERVCAMVIDTGGIGKKVAEELSARHGLPVVAAAKKEKQSHIEVLNDAMRQGKFFARRDSRFAHDTSLVEWDKDRLTPERKYISDRYHSDICDAVLYAHRESLAWLSGEVVSRPLYGSQEFDEQWKRDQFEKTMRDMEKQKTMGAPEDMDFGLPEETPWGTDDADLRF